ASSAPSRCMTWAMPQAIERSVATPTIRARLPARNPMQISPSLPGGRPVSGAEFIGTWRSLCSMPYAEAQPREWMKRPNRALQSFAPLALLNTDAGAALVVDELGRIEYGDLY